MPIRFWAPSERYRGYIFDCDGTLVDSMRVHHEAWRHALTHSSAPFEFDWALFLSRAGTPAVETVLALNEQFQCRLDPVLVVPLKDRYFSDLQHTLQPIHEVVDFARKAGAFAPLAVASGGIRVDVVQALRQVGILDLFGHVLTAEDVQRGKPDPEIFLKCAERLGVPPRECLVIEDGAAGIQAARAAGMACAVVATLA